MLNTKIAKCFVTFRAAVDRCKVGRFSPGSWKSCLQTAAAAADGARKKVIMSYEKKVLSSREMRRSSLARSKLSISFRPPPTRFYNTLLYPTYLKRRKEKSHPAVHNPFLAAAAAPAAPAAAAAAAFFIHFNSVDAGKGEIGDYIKRCLKLFFFFFHFFFSQSFFSDFRNEIRPFPFQKSFQCNVLVYFNGEFWTELFPFSSKWHH